MTAPKIEDGGPAGMPLRDWFAGQALVGILASLATAKGALPDLEKAVAETSFKFADAMIAARSTGGQS